MCSNVSSPLPVGRNTVSTPGCESAARSAPAACTTALAGSTPSGVTVTWLRCPGPIAKPFAALAAIVSANGALRGTIVPAAVSVSERSTGFEDPSRASVRSGRVEMTSLVPRGVAMRATLSAGYARTRSPGWRPATPPVATGPTSVGNASARLSHARTAGAPAWRIDAGAVAAADADDDDPSTRSTVAPSSDRLIAVPSVGAR